MFCLNVVFCFAEEWVMHDGGVAGEGSVCLSAEVCDKCGVDAAGEKNAEGLLGDAFLYRSGKMLRERFGNSGCVFGMFGSDGKKGALCLGKLLGE